MKHDEKARATKRKANDEAEAEAKAEGKVVDEAPNPQVGRGKPYAISETTTKQDN